MLLAGVGLAQAPSMPKPAPEHKKLEYFVGDWKSEGEISRTTLDFVEIGRIMRSTSRKHLRPQAHTFRGTAPD